MQRSRKRKPRTHQQAVRALRRSVPVASTLIMAISAAYAQERSTPAGLPEIVVTAQKRAERLQDVPIAVQAFETEKLEQLRIQDFEDYAKYLPNVSYQSYGPGFNRIFMRGVTSGDIGNHSGPLPSVGMYLDEQPVTTIQGPLDIHLYDIARVESLAGPQGTLYGASSQAGTIRIITNKPDSSGFAGGYDVEANTVSDGDPGGTVEGFVNIPLSDAMAVRLVGWYRHDGGYIDNVPGSRTFVSPGIGTVDNAAFVEDDYNDVDTIGMRAALRVDLNDSWTITPVLMYQRQESEGSFSFDARLGDLNANHYYPESTDDEWYQAALTVEGKIGNFEIVYAGAYLDRDNITESDYSDYSYFYDVFYQQPGTSYTYGDYFFNDDGDPINPSNFIRGEDRYKRQSHELRLSSPQDWPVRFVAGLFYQDSKHDIEQGYLVDGLATELEVTGWSDTWWLTQQRREDEEKAIFGEVSFDITEKLSATGGLRVFRTDNALFGFFGFGYTNGWSSTGEKRCFGFEYDNDPDLPFPDNPAVPPPSPGGSVNGGPCTNLDEDLDDTDETYKANLTYTLSPDALVYATYSTGYRPAGVNRRQVDPSLPPPTYRSDYLDNYEVGWKTTWADGRLRFNGAVFMQKWDDFQTSYLGPNGLPIVTNATNGAEIPGIETTVDWIPLEGLNLSAGAMWLDPELDGDYCQTLNASGQELSPAECLANNPDDYAPKGTTLPVTPEFKANFIARYDFQLGSFDASAQGSLVYQGDSEAALVPSDAEILGEQDAFTQADFSVSIGRDSWTAELFVDNAFDEQAELFKYTQCDEQKCGRTTSGQTGDTVQGIVYTGTIRPRTIGLRFGQKF